MTALERNPHRGGELSARVTSGNTAERSGKKLSKIERRFLSTRVNRERIVGLEGVSWRPAETSASCGFTSREKSVEWVEERSPGAPRRAPRSL